MRTSGREPLVDGLDVEATEAAVNAARLSPSASEPSSSTSHRCRANAERVQVDVPASRRGRPEFDAHDSGDVARALPVARASKPSELLDEHVPAGAEIHRRQGECHQIENVTARNGQQSTFDGSAEAHRSTSTATRTQLGATSKAALVGGAGVNGIGDLGGDGIAQSPEALRHSSDIGIALPPVARARRKRLLSSSVSHFASFTACGLAPP